MDTPKPTGTYAVGTCTFTAQGERKVSARVYYPVRREAIAGREPARYMSRAMTEALQGTFHVPMKYDRMEAKGENVSACYPDAPRIEGTAFPLVVFCHGLSSYREANSFLCIEMASHGYVVLALGFREIGVLTEYDDGTAVPFDRTLSKRMYDPFLGGVIQLMKLMKAKGSDREMAERFDRFQKQYCKALIRKVADCEQDVLDAVAYARDHLSDLIDFSMGIAVAGHSLGGVTAYALCLDHSEFICGINIDGAPFGDHAGKVLERPFLQICCTDNERVETRFLIDHTSPVWKAVFRDMKHAGFCDLKYLIPMKAVTGKMPENVMHENECRCFLEFLDAYLKKEKSQPDFVSSEWVTFTAYEPDLGGRME